MRKLILQMQMSVDGYVAAATPGLSWQLWDWSDTWSWDEVLRSDFNATLRRVDCILLSRKMAAEGYLDHWSGIADRHAGDAQFDFARRIGEAEKVVFSRSARGSQWEGTRLATRAMSGEIMALKKAKGLDMIAFGGAGFARSLLAADLVDELQLYINPAAVGDGTSIFDGHRTGLSFTLLGAQSYSCGIVVTRYAPRLAAGSPRSLESLPHRGAGRNRTDE